MFRNRPMRVVCGLLRARGGPGSRSRVRRARAGQEAQDRRRLRLHRPARRRRLRAARARRQDHDRLLHQEGRRRGLRRSRRVYADAQSKPDVAINEAVRLIEQEKVDMLLGFYSSAQCVPAAARVEQLTKFMWITTCISSAVLENRNLKYVFRTQPSGRQFGADVDGLPRPERQGQAGQGAQGPARRDHPRGRRLRRRRVEGQRGRRQEGRLQRRAEGRLLRPPRPTSRRW